MGFDARLQFVHETDLLDALRHATLAGLHGTFNIAGEGILMLSQAVRRLGRPTVPVPSGMLGYASTFIRQAGVAGLSPELVGYLTFGRGMDLTRMRDVLGFRPEFSTEWAFDDFGRTVNPDIATGRTSLSGVPAASEGGAHG
jgi:UDP-glucose 4-epimerase